LSVLALLGRTVPRRNRLCAERDYFVAMRTLLLFTGLFSIASAFAQSATSDIEQIRTTLMDYIEGTANGEPERLRRAFHPDFNLYTVNERDSLWVRSGKKYIAGFKPGERNERQGRIISIDVEHNAAMAKAEIVVPGWRVFTDYFLLLRYEGAWRIVQKSYTWRPLPKKAE